MVTHKCALSGVGLLVRGKMARSNLCVIPAFWGPEEFQKKTCADRSHFHVSEAEAHRRGLYQQADFMRIGHRRVLRLKRFLPLRGFSGHPSPPVPTRKGLLAAKGTKRALPTVRIKAPKKIGSSAYERFLDGLVRDEKWAQVIAASWRRNKD